MKTGFGLGVCSLLLTVGACQSPAAPGEQPRPPSAAAAPGDAGAVADLGAAGSGGAAVMMMPPADAGGVADLGASPDEGQPDAGPAPGNDAGSTVGAACTAMFCESFETIADGAPPDPAIWTRTSNDLVVDSSRAARGGKKSLHIPPLRSGAKYIRENKTIAALGTSFYGRVYVWIDQQPLEKPASLYHWTLLSADELQDFNAGKVLRVGGHIEAAGTNWMRFNFQTHGMPGETGLSDPQLTLSTKKWYCVEFYYSKIPSCTGKDRWAGTPFPLRSPG
ncbi:MAG TPA: hypothetical protein VGL59_07275 [Polyangia bacterium]|jgi:hypothetical protein